MIEEGSFLELLANMLAANKKEVRRLDLQEPALAKNPFLGRIVIAFLRGS